MQDSDLVRSPPTETTISRRSFDPDKIRANHKILTYLSKFTKEFIDFELESEELITHHFKELLKIHQEIGMTLDQCNKKVSRDENLKLILNLVAGRVNNLFHDAMKLRAKFEGKIEEASSMIYKENNDSRFPRSIFFGFNISKEIIVEDKKDVYSLTSTIQRYRDTLQDFTCQLTDLSKAHQLISLSHRAEELSADQEALVSFNEGIRIIKSYTA